MIIRVAGTDYRVDDAINSAALGDLWTLKVETKTAQFKGVSVPFIKNTLIAIGELLANDPDYDQDELLGDTDFIATLVGIIYLSRRAAGDPISVADAMKTHLSDIDIIDDEPEDEEDDPKALTDTPLVAAGETAA